MDCSTRIYGSRWDFTGDKDVVDIIGVFVSWDNWMDVYKDNNDEAATGYITFMRLQVTFSLFSTYCPNRFSWICVSFFPTFPRLLGKLVKQEVNW